MSKKKRSGYEVGYGRPPQATRFKKGQSGNPRGRPKAEKIKVNVTDIIEAVINRPVTITLDGKSITVSAIEAVIFRMLDTALKGDLRAGREFLKMIHERQLGGPPKGWSGDDTVAKLKREILRSLGEEEDESNAPAV